VPERILLMDGPRRRGRELLARAEEERAELDDDLARFEERRERLAAAVAARGQREQAVAAREAEFDRRAVTCADLAAENGVLRTELKNAAVHAAYLEQTQQLGRVGAAAVGQRDRLGRAYFEEVVTAAKKALTPSTYPGAKQKVRTAAERVRGEGAELPAADEERALATLHEQFEKAVRVSVEREEQARLREQMREELTRQKEIEVAEAEAGVRNWSGPRRQRPFRRRWIGRWRTRRASTRRRWRICGRSWRRPRPRRSERCPWRSRRGPGTCT
jgi:hypothetical protein